MLRGVAPFRSSVRPGFLAGLQGTTRTTRTEQHRMTLDQLMTVKSASQKNRTGLVMKNYMAGYMAMSVKRHTFRGPQ